MATDKLTATELTQQRKERLRNEAVHEYLHGHGSVEDQFGQGFDKGYEAGRSSLESENAETIVAMTESNRENWERAEKAESENARLKEWKKEVEISFAAGMLGLAHEELLGGKLSANEFVTLMKGSMRRAEEEFQRAIRGGTNANGQ